MVIKVCRKLHCLDLEDLKACATISSALNIPQGQGMVSHEMEAIACVANAVEVVLARSSIEGQADYHQVLAECSHTLPQRFAEKFDLIFDFVINCQLKFNT